MFPYLDTLCVCVYKKQKQKSFLSKKSIDYIVHSILCCCFFCFLERFQMRRNSFLSHFFKKFAALQLPFRSRHRAVRTFYDNIRRNKCRYLVRRSSWSNPTNDDNRSS